MKTLVLLAAIALGAGAQAPTDVLSNGLVPAAQDHTAWISGILRTIQTVRPGMTRRDVERLFIPDGGLSSGAPSIYVFRECLFIKVQVDFRPTLKNGVWGGSADDVIVKISRPYLEAMNID